MRLTLPLALGLFLSALPAFADDLDREAPAFHPEDIAMAYEVTAEAYSSFRLHFNRARSYFLVGDYTNSIKELERAYVLVGDPSALVNLGLAYDARAEIEAESGDYQKARVDKRMALRMFHNAERGKLTGADHTFCIKKTDQLKTELGRLREVDPVLAQLRKQAQQ